MVIEFLLENREVWGDMVVSEVELIFEVVIVVEIVGLLGVEEGIEVFVVEEIIEMVLVVFQLIDFLDIIEEVILVQEVEGGVFDIEE